MRIELLSSPSTPVHVMPVDDLMPHRFGMNCECRPRLDCENGSAVVIHTSYDGREMQEKEHEV